MCGSRPPPSWLPQPGAHVKRPVGVDAQASQLLKDDLNLAVELPHVQQEGDMVAVMPDDVVVHVDQDSGEEERRGVLRG